MTKLQYFNELVNRSLTGLFPSNAQTVHGQMCKYRTKDGRKCAAGIVIPDEQYNDQFETNSLYDFCGDSSDCSVIKYKLYEVVKENTPEEMSVNDIVQCQRVHDNYADEVFRNHRSWDHSEFVKRILALKCFREYGVI